MPNTCPSNAPPGSKWVTPAGGKGSGWCITPDGQMLDGNGKPLAPLPTAPTPGQVVPPGSGGTTQPTVPGSGLVTLPGQTGRGPIGGGPTIGMGGTGGPFGGGGTSIPVGGGGMKDWKNWVAPGIALLGGILKGIGGHKRNKATEEEAKRQEAAQNAEDLRLEAEAKERARGKTALIRGILNANGYGSMMTDEQILAMVTKTDPRHIYNRPNTAGGDLDAIGGGLQGIGGNLVLSGGRIQPRQEERPSAASAGSSIPGSSGGGTTGGGGGSNASAVDPVASGEFWSQLEEMLKQKRQAVLGGFGGGTGVQG